MELNQNEEEILNIITKGKNRIKIIIALIDTFKSPTDISKEMNVSLSSVCRSMNFLTSNEYILPLSDNPRVNNLYKLNSYVITDKLINLIRLIGKERDLC